MVAGFKEFRFHHSQLPYFTVSNSFIFDILIREGLTVEKKVRKFPYIFLTPMKIFYSISQMLLVNISTFTPIHQEKTEKI